MKILSDDNIKIIKTDKFKTINIRLIFDMELDYSEIAALNVLSKVLTTRNAKYANSREFNNFLDDNYGMTTTGWISIRGNILLFNIIISSLDSRYSLGENLLNIQIDTLKKCLYMPVLTEESLSEVKEKIIGKLKAKLNQKAYLLQQKVNDILGKDNPYGVNTDSDIENISNVTLDMLKEVYNKVVSSHFKVYVVGDIPDDISSYFDEFRSNKSLTKLNLSYIDSLPNYGLKEFNSHFFQSAIDLVYECNITYDNPLYYSLKVFIEMLNYDLFHIIREQYNYCYYIYAVNNGYLNMIEIVSEIESKNLNHVVELTNVIIDSYVNDFDEVKFDDCKKKIINYIKNNLDNPFDLLEMEFSLDFNQVVNDYKELIKKYEMIKKEDIIKVCKMVKSRMIAILKESDSDEENSL